MADIRTDHGALSPWRLNKQDNHLVGAITHVRPGNLCRCEWEWTRWWSRCLYSVWSPLFHHIVYFFLLSRPIFLILFSIFIIILFRFNSPWCCCKAISLLSDPHRQNKIWPKLMKITFLEQKLPTVVTSEDITRPHWSPGYIFHDNLELHNLISADHLLTLSVETSNVTQAHI